jgi:hypothetical protein
MEMDFGKEVGSTLEWRYPIPGQTCLDIFGQKMV